LDKQRQQGTDISPTLNGLNLSLDAFNYLVKLSAIYSPPINGALLDSEWQDVFSILVQVQKIGQYPAWRTQESSGPNVITLSPDWFQVAGDSVDLPPWRASSAARRRWQRTLEERIADQRALSTALSGAIDTAEDLAMPSLRDALVHSILALPSILALNLDEDQLSRRLLIDVAADASLKITRCNQATEAMQSLLFSLRNEGLQNLPDLRTWELNPDVLEPLPGHSATPFDQEWNWIGSYSGWLAAMSTFLYPQNLLLPNLWPGWQGPPTAAFENFLLETFNHAPLAPDRARTIAADYLAALRFVDFSNPIGPPRPAYDLPSELKDPATGLITTTITIDERRSDPELNLLAGIEKTLYANYVANQDPHGRYIWEIFFFVPLQLALQLEQAGQYSAALDWYRTLYAYTLLAAQAPDRQDPRKIWYGLVAGETNGSASYNQAPDWLYYSLNPHPIASSSRMRAYTRFVLTSIAQCMLAFADSQYTANTFESLAKARTLYLTALDLLSSPELLKIPVLEDWVPDNPLLTSLKTHARLNIKKLSSGLDFAGQRGQVPARPGGQYPLLPTDYSYQTLIDRSKQLVTVAQQAEGSYLGALEKSDNEQYNDLKAQQDLAVANANTTLQDRMVTEASDGVTLASDQIDRANIQVKHYNDLISSDIIGLEYMSIAFLQAQAGFEAIGGIISLVTGGVGQGLSSLGAAAGATASVFSSRANLEEKQKDWQFQLDLSNEDVTIATQQRKIASDHVDVASQQQNIAYLQQHNASNVLTFLTTQKFTNAVLYQWMSGILGGVYSHLLQHATAVAWMAQTQLSFERQEPPLNVIQPDYWQPPTNINPSVPNASGGGNGQVTDTRGLTGSSRLLADIFQLDEYAFETNRRKLQITKTISLAQLDPFAFQQFRTSGVLRFATPESLFDADYPGHYLRIIQQVRTTVIALIPPALGIRATLSNLGVSRAVVINDAGPSTVVVRRDPQQVALTSPSNATGLFQMDAQSSLLAPFQGLGVDTSWQFEMARAANPFDFNSIADVQIAIDYTALDDPSYRKQAINNLGTDFGADRGYSFAQQFPDQWYALNNPDPAVTPISVTFTTLASDFPPNVSNPAITQLLMHFAPGQGSSNEMTVRDLQFVPQGNGKAIDGLGATSSGGVISTRRGNAPNWKSKFVDVGAGASPLTPIGKWTISLDNTPASPLPFASGQVTDILFVISYQGTTPAWPDA